MAHLRFAHINSRHGNARIEKLPVHPTFRLVGILGERRAVEDPGLFAAGG